MEIRFRWLKKIKIGILTNIPTPYRKPMWEAYLKIKDVTFDVFYFSKMHKDRKWNFDKADGVKEIFLKGPRLCSLNLEIFALLKKYDLWIIGGYSDPTAQLLILLCKIFRIPYVIMFDGVSPKKIESKENKLKFVWKRFLVKNCFAFLGNGTVGRLYAKKLGVHEDRIYNQYLTVDIEHFMNLLNEKNKMRSIIRQNLSIPKNGLVLLYIGRLIKLKGVQDLIKAYSEIKQQNQNVYLLIVGFGTYEKELKRMSQSIKDIFYVGHVDYPNIHKYYFASDILILPTYDDSWGLVINEAMACGLPVVTTTASGASLDLIKNNGYVFEPGDVKALVDIIKRYVREPNLILRHSQNSLKIIKEFSFDKSKKEVEKIIKNYLEKEEIK
jgi:glycosyltransferase involved in cell wall biosynthesis